MLSGYSSHPLPTHFTAVTDLEPLFVGVSPCNQMPLMKPTFVHSQLQLMKSLKADCTDSLNFNLLIDLQVIYIYIFFYLTGLLTYAILRPI